MDIDTLVKELKSDEPDLNLIRSTLKGSPDLVNGIIFDNVSSLHLAARNDVLYGTSLTELLLTEFKANPNIQNESGSIPLFWGLAACQEQSAKGKTPHWHSIKFLINHPSFKLHKTLQYRGRVIDFILTYYKSPELISMVEEAIWIKRFPFLSAIEITKSCNID